MQRVAVELILKLAGQRGKLDYEVSWLVQTLQSIAPEGDIKKLAQKDPPF